ncbi:MAG: DUF456 domain-containing protein, partial [Nitrospiraceae bacterium]
YSREFVNEVHYLIVTMNIVLIIIGGLMSVTGIIGCFLPVLPGPVLCFAALLLLQASTAPPFSMNILIAYGCLTALVALFDYIIPVYGTKKLEGSKYGVWGSVAGLIIGVMFFFPLGIVLGPMAGAFAGELISGKPVRKALRSAAGSLLGFLASTALKLALAAAMAIHFVAAASSLLSAG